MSRASSPSHRSLRPLTQRGLGFAVAGFVALASVPGVAVAAPPKEDAAAGDGQGEVGGNVALLVFEGDADAASTLRYAAQTGLSEAGYNVVGVKQTLTVTAGKVKCKDIDEACQAKVAKYLTKNSKTAPDFYVYGTAGAPGTPSTVTIYDVKNEKVVDELNFIFDADSDMIAPIALPKAMGQAVVDYQDPPAPMTAEEAAIVAQLDEPEMTEEEKAEQERKLKEAQEASLRAYNSGLDVGAQRIDLKKDFDKVCRPKAEPRKDVKTELPDGTVEVAKDLRPICERGPGVGYWQPRSWVALSLTVAAGATTGLLYGLAAGARSNWSSANDDLQGALDSGAAANDPADPAALAEYERLAGQVSADAQQVRNFALGGDIALGATLILGGVLGIIIWQDRQAARDYLEREAEMNISDLRVSPMADPKSGSYGAGASFKF